MITYYKNLKTSSKIANNDSRIKQHLTKSLWANNSFVHLNNITLIMLNSTYIGDTIATITRRLICHLFVIVNIFIYLSDKSLPTKVNFSIKRRKQCKIIKNIIIENALLSLFSIRNYKITTHWTKVIRMLKDVLVCLYVCVCACVCLKASGWGRECLIVFR